MVAASLRSANGIRYVVVAPRLGAVVRPREGGYFHMLASADAARLRPDATALLDGSMFGTCGGSQRRGESDTAFYRRVDCGRPNFRLLDRAAGVDVASRRPRDGLTISLTAEGRASVDAGDAVAAGATFAIQLYPPLVRRGAVVASNSAGTNGQQSWRAGIGVTRDGQLILAVGRLDMVAFARAMLAAGAVDAGYTDGGGSGRIVAGGTTYGSSENRPVPVWIAALGADAPAPPAAPVPDQPPPSTAPETPETTDPVERGDSAAAPTGVMGKVLAAVLAAAGAGAWWRYGR